MRKDFLMISASHAIEARPGSSKLMMPVEVLESSLTEGGEWVWCEAPPGVREELASSANVLVEVSVEGKAAAAGLSFGDFKDFLVPVHPSQGPRLLQLEVDREAGNWAFRAEGTLVARQWWNAAVKSVDDLPGGSLCLKAHHAKSVTFRQLRVRPFASSCRMSVVIVSNRFGKRLRVALRSWAQQSVPSGTLEVIVVNPASPDDTHAVVAAAARDHPGVRIAEVAADAVLARNKGALINLGLAVARGEWIWLTDADCLYPETGAAHVLARLGSRSALYYCERRHLTEQATNGLIKGHADAVYRFEELIGQTRADTNVCPWGYCQIVHRSVLDRVRYREHVNAYSDSDNFFVADCVRSGVQPVRLEGLSCLHLVHPFAWGGTNDFL
ncbi:MAG TPA: glycosyltransferase family 2 protein [Thermoanaerobaculia bacterium]|nr:glycosyltransferase family 2 protein [Thermoanaerobaculia bacterium]